MGDAISTTGELQALAQIKLLAERIEHLSRQLTELTTEARAERMESRAAYGALESRVRTLEADRAADAVRLEALAEKTRPVGSLVKRVAWILGALSSGGAGAAAVKLLGGGD